MDAAHERFLVQAYESAQITPLTSNALTLTGHIAMLSGNDMDVVLDRQLEAGTAVRVQARNWLMLAEVLYCVPGPSHHKARLRVEHALPGLQELNDMSRRFFGQTARDRPMAGRDASGYSGWT
jgi:hypothetical protein